MWKDNVIYGLKAELAASSEFEEFVIGHVEQDGSIRKVFVRLDEASGKLDESLEGSESWWAGPPKGAADVLSVIPEEEQLNLRFATAPLPAAGQRFRVYPPMYLQRLLELWERPDNAERFLNRLEHPALRQPHTPSAVPAAPSVPLAPRAPARGLRLPCMADQLPLGAARHRQDHDHRRHARHLPRRSHPGRRALLLSTTNNAVDQALIAVDKALQRMSNSASLRNQCARIGNHFLAGNYKGREHLLPIKDVSLVHAMAQLEARTPERGARPGLRKVEGGGRDPCAAKCGSNRSTRSPKPASRP